MEQERLREEYQRGYEAGKWDTLKAVARHMDEKMAAYDANEEFNAKRRKVYNEFITSP